MSDQIFALGIIAVTVAGAVVAIRMLWLMLNFGSRSRSERS